MTDREMIEFFVEGTPATLEQAKAILEMCVYVDCSKTATMIPTTDNWSESKIFYFSDKVSEDLEEVKGGKIDVLSVINHAHANNYEKIIIVTDDDALVDFCLLMTPYQEINVIIMFPDNFQNG